MKIKNNFIYFLIILFSNQLQAMQPKGCSDCFKACFKFFKKKKNNDKIIKIVNTNEEITIFNNFFNNINIKNSNFLLLKNIPVKKEYLSCLACLNYQKNDFTAIKFIRFLYYLSLNDIIINLNNKNILIAKDFSSYKETFNADKKLYAINTKLFFYYLTTNNAISSYFLSQFKAETTDKISSILKKYKILFFNKKALNKKLLKNNFKRVDIVSNEIIFDMMEIRFF